MVLERFHLVSPGQSRTVNAQKGLLTMGLSYIEGTVTGPSGVSRSVEFLIDSGAIYTCLPREIWQALGLQPARSSRFVLADGTPIERNVSECLLSIPQGSAHTPVVLGEAGDATLLGVVTLEEMGLVFNPFNRTLQPMRMMMA